MNKLALKKKSSRTSFKETRHHRQQKNIKKEGFENRKAAKKEALEWLKKKYWGIRSFKPLAIGTLQKIRDTRPEGMAGVAVARALSYHCNGRKYLTNVIKMENRFTFRGKETDQKITPEHKIHAKKAMAELNRKQKEKNKMGGGKK